MPLLCASSEKAVDISSGQVDDMARHISCAHPVNRRGNLQMSRSPVGGVPRKPLLTKISSDFLVPGGRPLHVGVRFISVRGLLHHYVIDSGQVIH
jgi:hypothetical protein